MNAFVIKFVHQTVAFYTGFVDRALKSKTGKHASFHSLEKAARRLLPINLYKSADRVVYWVEMPDETQSPPAWLEPLYESHAPGLLLYGRALGLSHSESEDLVQETFLRLMKLSAPPDTPEFYCLRAFRNRVINYRRRFWRRIARELESKRWFERSPRETPRERAAMQALAKLPAEQREVIVLKFWSRYTFDQIGQLLSLSPNTVAGRYRYGLNKLRNTLRHEYETESPGDSLVALETA